MCDWKLRSWAFYRTFNHCKWYLTYELMATWKNKEFLMLRYVSLPKAAKTHVSTFLKNDALKLSKNLLQCFRSVWEHPQPNWKLVRHTFFGHYTFVKMATGFSSHLHPAVADNFWPKQLKKKIPDAFGLPLKITAFTRKNVLRISFQ